MQNKIAEAQAVLARRPHKNADCDVPDLREALASMIALNRTLLDQSAAIAKARNEIADLCLPLAETDTDYDWGVKVGAYTCLAILDRHLAPASEAE